MADGVRRAAVLWFPAALVRGPLKADAGEEDPAGLEGNRGQLELPSDSRGDEMDLVNGLATQRVRRAIGPGCKFMLTCTEF